MPPELFVQIEQATKDAPAGVLNGSFLLIARGTPLSATLQGLCNLHALTHAFVLRGVDYEVSAGRLC